MNLAASQDDQTEVTLTRIISGQSYRELRQLQKKQRELNGQVAARRLDIDRISEGPVKQRSMEIWQQAKARNDQAYQKLREAVDQYNNMARSIRTVTLGVAKPKMMSGLGAFPLVAILGALPWIAGAALAFSVLVTAIKTDLSFVTNSLKALADIPRSIGGAATDLGETMEKVMWAATGLLGVYVVFTLFREWRGGKQTFTLPRFQTAAAAPTPLPRQQRALPAPARMLDVKPVSVEVL